MGRMNGVSEGRRGLIGERRGMGRRKQRTNSNNARNIWKNVILNENLNVNVEYF